MPRRRQRSSAPWQGWPCPKPRFPRQRPARSAKPTATPSYTPSGWAPAGRASKAATGRLAAPLPGPDGCNAMPKRTSMSSSIPYVLLTQGNPAPGPERGTGKPCPSWSPFPIGQVEVIFDYANICNARIAGRHGFFLSAQACGFILFPRFGRRAASCDCRGLPEFRNQRKENGMQIGCPKEIKPQEFRVGLTPAAAAEAAAHGHQVLVEAGAGLGAGFSDEDYLAAGARIAPDAAAVYGDCDL